MKSFREKLLKRKEGDKTNTVSQGYPTAEAAYRDGAAEENRIQVVYSREISDEKKAEMQDIEEKIASGGNGTLEVINTMDSYTAMSKEEIMREIALAGYGEMVGEHIGKFHGVDHNILAKIMVSQPPTGVDALMRILHNLRNLNKKEVWNAILRSETDPERKNLLQNKLQEHADSFADTQEEVELAS